MEPIEFIDQAVEISEPVSVHRELSYIFWSLILINLIAIAIVRTKNPGHIKTLFITAIFNRQLLQNTQENLKLYDLGGILLNLAYFNCFAIIATELLATGGSFTTLIVLAVTCGVMLLKLGSIKLIAFLSKSQDGSHEHILNHFIFFQIAAIVITPILIFSHFLPSQIAEIVGIVVVGIVLLLIFIREVQSFVRAIRLRLSVLYIILYLCTLELLPLVLIIKVFVSNYQGLN